MKYIILSFFFFISTFTYGQDHFTLRVKIVVSDKKAIMAEEDTTKPEHYEQFRNEVERTCRAHGFSILSNENQVTHALEYSFRHTMRDNTWYWRCKLVLKDLRYRREYAPLVSCELSEQKWDWSLSLKNTKDLAFWVTNDVFLQSKVYEERLKIEELKKQFQEKEREIEKRIQELAENINDLKKQNQEHQKETENLQQEIADLKTKNTMQNAVQSTEIADLKAKNITQSTEIADLKKKVTSLEGEITSVRKPDYESPEWVTASSYQDGEIVHNLGTDRFSNFQIIFRESEIANKQIMIQGMSFYDWDGVSSKGIAFYITPGEINSIKWFTARYIFAHAYRDGDKISEKSIVWPGALYKCGLQKGQFKVRIWK